MISQIVTLVGVLVGALTSYVATTGAERVRHRHTLATRWDEKKFQTYVDYAAFVKAAAEAAGAAARAESGSEARAEYLSAMEAAELKRSTTFEALILLADPAAVEVAHKVNRLLWTAFDRARDPGAHSGPGLELTKTLNVLHERARKDLGISLT